MKRLAPCIMVQDAASGVGKSVATPLCRALVYEDGAELRAAGADVDDVASGMTPEATPLPVADWLGERVHAVKDGVNPRHDVYPVIDEGRAFGHPQRDMQARPVLRHRAVAQPVARATRDVGER